MPQFKLPSLPKLPPLPPAARWILYPLMLLVGTGLIAAAMLAIVTIVLYPQLPSLEALTDYRPKVPLRIYTADGYLIGEFGEERRDPVHIQDVPALMKHAILAAEDERFYSHPGVDTLGVLRAAYSNVVSGGKAQGASTITMQVARNFFLTREKTLTRKLYEVLLAFKIEASLSKDEILQLYCNQIYLGQRAYGFASAAQIYFGKTLNQLTPAEAAMLAGLPKAPSSYNPVANPKRAQLRQHYVLRRMNELHFIDDAQYEAAKQEHLNVKRNVNDFGTRADYVAEMARQIAVERYSEDAYNQGLRVITTIVKAEQDAANASLRKGVLDYDRRHGYRGAEKYIDPKEFARNTEEEYEDALSEITDVDDMPPALVLEASPSQIKAYRRGGEMVTLSGDSLKFAARMLEDSAPANKRLRRGAVIRLIAGPNEKQPWLIAQQPEVESAFVAASPVDGSVRALVGGFDFNRNKFNHVTQAWRQPGSSFKPFIYSAAIEKGFNAASIVPDEPIVISAEETGSQAWEPKNYDGKYDGPMTLRTALAKSKNMVSIRLLKSIGTRYAQDYITRFGFDADKHPPYLTMALGAGSVTPWQQLAAYSVFANGGFRIQPFIVRQIQDSNGKVLAEFKPTVAGEDRVIEPRNAYIMDSMLHDVVRRGTGSKAYTTLKRGDMAGKTGTTNDYIDAWFCGYQPTVVGIAWIGFDQPKRMGSGETGGTAALPIWIGYMQTALKGVPESYMDVPEGLAAINAADPSGKVQKELIYKEQLPPEEAPDPSEPLPTTGPAPAPAPVSDAKPKAVTR
ncbi:MAG TPA: penicillin-binding protein 1A [Rhodocyclaceae bacterium]|nr:penicillin-binding protein 1A [Rhodocyclaceae bacterium]